MSDMISKQAAIDAIDKIFPVDPMRNEYTQGIACGAALAKEYIKQLPAVEPEPCEDAISRQAAIRIVNGIDTWQAGWRDNAIESMKALSAVKA